MIQDHGVYLFCQIFEKSNNNNNNIKRIDNDDIKFHTNDYILKILNSSGEEIFNSSNIFMPVPINKKDDGS